MRTSSTHHEVVALLSLPLFGVICKCHIKLGDSVNRSVSPSAFQLIGIASTLRQRAYLFINDFTFRVCWCWIRMFVSMCPRVESSPIFFLSELERILHSDAYVPIIWTDEEDEAEE